MKCKLEEVKFTEQQLKDLSIDRDKYDLYNFHECNYKTHSISWFYECLKDCEVSNNIKEVSIKLCKKYNIKGVCDPAYISNVINDNNKINAEPTTPKEITKRLMFCYGCNIEKNITNYNYIIRLIRGLK